MLWFFNPSIFSYLYIACSRREYSQGNSSPAGLRLYGMLLAALRRECLVGPQKGGKYFSIMNPA